MSAGTGDRDLYLEQALFLTTSGQPVEAEAVLREAIASYPLDADLVGNLGRVLLIQGKAAEALEAADEAASLRQSDEWPHRLASYALARLGRRAEALARAERAVAVDPQSALAIRAVFEAQLGLGLVGEATRTAQLAGEMAPDEVWPVVDRARAAIADHDAAQAEGILRPVLSRDPGNADARSLLGVSLRMQGKELEAIPELSEAAALQDNSGFTNRQLVSAIDRYVGIWPILVVVFVGWASLQIGVSLKLGSAVGLTVAGIATLIAAVTVIGLHRRRVRPFSAAVWERYKAEQRRTRGRRYGWVAFSFGTFLLTVLSVPAVFEVGSLVHSEVIVYIGVLWLLAAIPAWRVISTRIWQRYVLPRLA